MTDLFIEVAQTLGPPLPAALSFLNNDYRLHLAQYDNLTYRDPRTGASISIPPAFSTSGNNAYHPGKPQFGYVVFLHRRADMDQGTAYMMSGGIVNAVLIKTAPADGPIVTVPDPSGYSGSITYPSSFWVDVGPVTVLRGSVNGAAIIRGTGAQYIEAFGYNDTIAANRGSALIKAGRGSASVDAGSGNVTVVLDGYGNQVVGLNGDDAVGGSLGSTTIRLGDGNDSIAAGGYGNRITLGNGNDTVDAGRGGAFVAVGDGHDIVMIAGYGDTVGGGNGGDTVIGGAGSETIALGSGRNMVATTGYGNRISVGSGDDDIAAGTGGAHVTVGTSPATTAGHASVLLAGWSNVVDLMGGNDTVFGGAGNDVITAAGGDDLLIVVGIGERLVLNQGVSASVGDSGTGLTIHVTSSADKVTITGFGRDPTAIVDLAIPGGRYGSVAAVVQALHADGQGGTTLTLGPQGSVDFTDIARGQLTAAHFKIG